METLERPAKLTPMDKLRKDLYLFAGRWRELAADTGIAYDTVSRIARGFTPSPTIDTFLTMRKWLNKHRVKRT